MSVSWDYYDKFEDLIDKYMPLKGEGDTLASQIVTAVNKLVYKWYNDGDVFDNTHYLNGWANDLSSYANWLRKWASGDSGCDTILDRVYGCYNDSDYENLLKDLADCLLDEDWLHIMEKEKVGSIYNCDGPYAYEVIYDDEEDEDYYDSFYYDEEEDEDYEED